MDNVFIPEPPQGEINFAAVCAIDSGAPNILTSSCQGAKPFIGLPDALLVSQPGLPR
jgi:hypothetical protein